jgi:hypothetical protein
MRVLKIASRIVLSTSAGVVTFLGTMTHGCKEVDGVSDWERCTSWFGNPILEWPGGDYWSLVFPLLLGMTVGILVWWLLGLTPLKRAE